MNILNRSETLDQLLIRIDHPEFNTVEGRVLDELKLTMDAIANREHPRTTLGGLITPLRFEPPNGERTAVQIAVAARIPVDGRNHRGDTISDVLSDLVNFAIAEITNPQSPFDTILNGPENPRYRLSPAVQLTQNI